MNGLAEKLDAIQARVDARMAEINRRFGEVAGTDAVATASGVRRLPEAERLIRSVISTPAGGPAKSSASQWELSSEALAQLLNYVVSSPHVTNNSQYAKLVSEVQLKYATEQKINACAMYEDGVPTICVMPGAVRYAHLVSAAYVACIKVKENTQGAGGPFPEIVDALAQLVSKTCSTLTARDACTFADRFNLHLVMGDQVLARKVRSYASGLLIGVLAHEFGHLALGHLCGKSQTLEISRNQEREADSFASSVISSSPFADYMVFGSILWEMVWVWQEKKNGAVATTHPLASERLADLIRANPTTAAELGLSVPAGASMLSTAEVAVLSGQAAGAAAGNVRYDWTCGTICAWGCLGECHGN